MGSSRGSSLLRVLDRRLLKIVCLQICGSITCLPLINAHNKNKTKKLRPDLCSFKERQYFFRLPRTHHAAQHVYDLRPARISVDVCAWHWLTRSTSTILYVVQIYWYSGLHQYSVLAEGNEQRSAYVSL